MGVSRRRRLDCKVGGRSLRDQREGKRSSSAPAGLVELNSWWEKDTLLLGHDEIRRGE